MSIESKIKEKSDARFQGACHMYLIFNFRVGHRQKQVAQKLIRQTLIPLR